MSNKTKVLIAAGAILIIGIVSGGTIFYRRYLSEEDQSNVVSDLPDQSPVDEPTFDKFALDQKIDILVTKKQEGVDEIIVPATTVGGSFLEHLEFKNEIDEDHLIVGCGMDGNRLVITTYFSGIIVTTSCLNEGDPEKLLERVISKIIESLSALTTVDEDDKKDIHQCVVNLFHF